MAGLFAALSVAVFISFPECVSSSAIGLPWYAALFLPLFVIGVVTSLAFDFSIEQKWLPPLIKALALFGCLLALLQAGEALAGWHVGHLITQNFGAFFYGFCVLTFLVVFFFALTGSLPWALRLTGILMLVYCCTNYFLILFRGTPLLPMDIFGWQTAMGVLSNYSLQLTRELAESALLYLGVFLLSPRLTLPQPPRLAAWVSRGAALALALLFFCTTVTRSFISTRFEPYLWDQRVTAQRNGTLVNFLANLPESFARPPKGYSGAAVRSIAANYTSDSTADAQTKPDVVLILGESWADLLSSGQAETDVPVMPFISSLGQTPNTEYSKLVVSTYGGGTSQSEFELFTGANLEYGFHAAPFQFNVKKPLPNLASQFKQLGYQTIAIHPDKAQAWGRDKAFPLLGFDEYITMDSFAEEDREWLRWAIRDASLHQRTLQILEQAQQPTFVYAITIASHGGYLEPDYPSTVHLSQPEGEYPKTEQYLSLLNESDKDLEAFIQSLQTRQRPTIVLFFGDHLPKIESEYLENVVEASHPLGRHQTFYGVWANYPLPKIQMDQSENLSLSYLGCYLMQKAGLPLTAYQKFLIECAQEFPVISTGNFVNTNGELIPNQEVKTTELYHRQSFVQYNLVYDRKHLPQDFFTLKEAE